jgi:hypothetical protein
MHAPEGIRMRVHLAAPSVGLSIALSIALSLAVSGCNTPPITDSQRLPSDRICIDGLIQAARGHNHVGRESDCR